MSLRAWLTGIVAWQKATSSCKKVHYRRQLAAPRTCVKHGSTMHGTEDPNVQQWQAIEGVQVDQQEVANHQKDRNTYLACLQH